MRSHDYQIRWADAVRAAAPPLAAVALVAAILHLGVWIGVWPRPIPALDVDRTVLLHQAAASEVRSEAELIFVGDSSCLMDVDPRVVARATGRPALNLGTLSHLDLEGQQRLLGRFFQANPVRGQTVVLLMNPASLRLWPEAAWPSSILDDFYARRDPIGHSSGIDRWLGFEIVRARLLGPAWPTPLPGAFGQRYGFTRDLWRAMSAQGGHLIDPRRLEPGSIRGSTEYSIAAVWEKGGRLFRSRLPRGIRLAAGFTPVPVSLTDGDLDRRGRDLLRQWAEWLEADQVLTGLPAAWGDDRFATPTHLDEEGAREFSMQLGIELGR
ncbi:MAG TPA: hypothetical protein P5555_15295 [Candidatus Paceibacterota bacterium]|nr:hypothetical protein [Verrucomicrobiota bacterium]HOX03645.1 hypothetical protein [Verrucomicrobiota bacterium]HRZ46548.1 hypothetical protein [Candidatus Paceibacterota bacterium]HRZ93667.1 hypothetical protein [Candidatus Paceibacterota bacterium]